jgi:hypothetical protein
LALAGVNVRGAVGGESLGRLTGAGVEAQTAARLADLLRECEAARFAPDAGDVPAARDRWMRARGVIRDMERRRSARSSENGPERPRPARAPENGPARS